MKSLTDRHQVQVLEHSSRRLGVNAFPLLSAASSDCPTERLCIGYGSCPKEDQLECNVIWVYVHPLP